MRAYSIKFSKKFTEIVIYISTTKYIENAIIVAN